MHIDASLDTIMAGLRCAEPSPAAWPAIADGIDAFVTVSDAGVETTMEALAREGIVAGPSGACGPAAVHSITDRAPDLRIGPTSRALTVVTEGA